MAPTQIEFPASSLQPIDASGTPQGCTNLKLRQLMRRVASHYDHVVGASGLKGTQYSLLSYVVKLGPMRSVDLAAALKVSASTLSRNLQPLLNAGWLAIQPGPDARSHQVVATDAGVAKRAQAQLLWKVAQLDVNRRLGEARVHELHVLLDECMQLMDSDEVDQLT
jgi:DNA-binding MarR family transcriptional regulator